jgi:hypothetical protein
MFRTRERSGWRNVFPNGREYHMKLSFTFHLLILSVICTRSLHDIPVFYRFTKCYSSYQNRDDTRIEHSINAGCRTVERLGLCMGLQKITQADRKVEVARQSTYRDTDVGANVIDHIRGVVPDDRLLTPLSCHSRRAISFCLTMCWPLCHVFTMS